VTSFSRQALAAAKQAAPHWPRGFVTDIWQDDWREVVALHDCSTIHVGHRALDAASVKEAIAHDIDVLAYVIDDPAVAHQMWDYGVAAIFSDRPDNHVSPIE
jgi:glycerophosphoryl diester phosphodiesterase